MATYIKVGPPACSQTEQNTHIALYRLSKTAAAMCPGIPAHIAKRRWYNPLHMSRFGLLGEFLQFLRTEKKYWLLPIVVVLVLFGLLTLSAQSSAIAPFIYTLF